MFYILECLITAAFICIPFLIVGQIILTHRGE